MDWDRLFRFCEEQTVLGVGYKELEKLVYKGMSIPKLLKFTWYAAYEQIAARNRELNTKAVEVCREYEREGFRCCLLKGQGNAAMYPDPLSRAPGDVDIFVIERSNDRKAITEYVRKRHEVADIRYHHIEYESDGILVEIHFTPCIMNNPLYNRRLQRWIYNDFKTTQINIGDSQYPITVPTIETNIVYQLAHMMHHFFDEGLGLRQVMDYYYVLRSLTPIPAETPSHSLSREGEGNIYLNALRDTLKRLNLEKFAGAVMWVEHEVFGLEEQYFIVPADKWRGRTLLDEILKGGNFGQHSGLTQHGTVAKYFLKIKRNMQFVCQYPAEALCEPFFRTWHFFWRISQQ